MSAERRNDELQETSAPIPAASVAGEVRLKGTVGLTSLPEVSRSGNQVTLTSRNQVRYRNESVLGRGGMGEVQLASDQDIGRRVAVERLLDERIRSRWLGSSTRFGRSADWSIPTSSRSMMWVSMPRAVCSS